MGGNIPGRSFLGGVWWVGIFGGGGGGFCWEEFSKNQIQQKANKYKKASFLSFKKKF